MASLSSASAAARIVSQSEDEPMMMPTSGFIARYYQTRSAGYGTTRARRPRDCPNRHVRWSPSGSATAGICGPRRDAIHELLERRRTLGEQPLTPRFEPLVLLGVERRVA